MHMNTPVYRNTQSVSGRALISRTRVQKTQGNRYILDTIIPHTGAVVTISAGLAQACPNYKTRVPKRLLVRAE